MIDQMVAMKLMVMRVNHYWGGHNEGLDAAEEAMRIAREANRPDLELEALEMHGSIQSQRYGRYTICLVSVASGVSSHCRERQRAKTSS